MESKGDGARKITEALSRDACGRCRRGTFIWNRLLCISSAQSNIHAQHSRNRNLVESELQHLRMTNEQLQKQALGWQINGHGSLASELSKLNNEGALRREAEAKYDILLQDHDQMIAKYCREVEVLRTQIKELEQQLATRDAQVSRLKPINV